MRVYIHFFTTYLDLLPHFSNRTMTLAEYVDNIGKRYKLGNSTEHTFRGDLQTLIQSLVPGIAATNEPKRQAFGAPDYILTRNDIPVGFIEAKDIGDNDLEGAKKAGNKEQFDRYKVALNNIIFTDYLNFHLYIDGLFVTKISIAEVTSSGIKPLPGNFEKFINLITDFCGYKGQTIKSSKKLAEMMAGKAKLLSEIIEKSVTNDEDNEEDSTLKAQMEAFKEVLIHDITAKDFADVYAQTIAYGMLAARLHDSTLSTFSRQEAAELIPKTNPFLRKLFIYIAGPDIDDRIKWIVDSLAEIFLACNVNDIFKGYGRATKTEDPIIHFYETFLSEYDPALRKARGVWYTPAPVVNFIVRAVDDILKTEFSLSSGLADTSKTIVKVKTVVKATADKRSKIKIIDVDKEVHKVQILDPATGTGTFLAEVVKHIHKKYEGQEGIWSSYVESQLLPRLNGFELLMASYAMAHLQLDLLLTKTGYKPIKPQRLKVYLTNSLEEEHPQTGTIFANWLSTEANDANYIKRDTPVMCVIGNPPYNGESSNKGEWIMSLMEDYKKEPGGKEKLRERTVKWLNDDYVKFLRYGQHFIEDNGSGILAFINPHGFLDNPTFRGMRWHLLKTYDKIYTIDLHGNSNKKETALDGSADVNVFDIMQGVSINIFVKTGKKKLNELGQIFHHDIYGTRDSKYNFLIENSLKTIKFQQLELRSPNYVFRPQSKDLLKLYNEGFSLSSLFQVYGNGITTAHDSFVIKNNKKEALDFFTSFKNSERNVELLHKKFDVKKKAGWDILEGYDNIKNQSNIDKYLQTISYRPFDKKVIFYEDKLVWRTVRKVMNNYVNHDNIGLLTTKAFKDKSFNHVFVTNDISEAIFLSSLTGSNAMNFPLYIYSNGNGQQSISTLDKRIPNLDKDEVRKMESFLGLTFIEEKIDDGNTFAPVDILDYIYSVLHSPTYREKYTEFLKVDFPRIPYPNDKKVFKQLVKLGKQIRKIHLLEDPIVEDYVTRYPISGDNIVKRSIYQEGKVYINESQYFDNVPQVAWDFNIGGYQPAQKWLKDRKDKNLEFDDILHYQRMVVALVETDRLMAEVDKVFIE